MAVLFDAFMTIDHSLFQQNNLFILTAVLKSWMIVQSFGDLFGAGVDVGPLYFVGVMGFFFTVRCASLQIFWFDIQAHCRKIQDFRTCTATNSGNTVYSDSIYSLLFSRT